MPDDLARSVSIRCLLLSVAAMSTFAPGIAHAKSHLWRFTEIFSTADGSVQFIEMQVTDPAGTGEWVIQGFELRSDSQSFIFPNNLPMENTFERWLLIATPAFASLRGAPTPDFTIPPGFFDPDGDTLIYRNGIDGFFIPTGVTPTDGVHSLAPDLTTSVNSPINFAGEAGSVTVASGAIPLLPPWGVLLGLLLPALGCVALARRQRVRTNA
jgi:hypothetical protein